MYKLHQGRFENGIYQVTTNYDLSLPEMIEATGCECGQIFTAEMEGKKRTGKETRNFRLLHYGQLADLPTVSIAHKVNQANCFELLAFATAHPEAQYNFPIMALRGHCRQDGYMVVPYLTFFDDKRQIGIDFRNEEFNGDFRFLYIC